MFPADAEMPIRFADGVPALGYLDPSGNR